jgi:hypothetical protein
MSNEQDEQEKRGFKVEDRRRFSESGEARPETQDTPTREAPPQSATAAGPGAAPQAVRRDTPPIDINFSTFVISLSTQALAHLGEIPHPLENQIEVDLGAAKQLIDILGILKDKTKGNLDQSESGLLDNVLYDLRLRYVECVRSHSQKA